LHAELADMTFSLNENFGLPNLHHLNNPVAHCISSRACDEKKDE
jgi:hypothetical protein